MSTDSIKLEAAIARHRLGHIDEAQGVYQALSESQPDWVEPWHLLGVVQLQRGDPEKAEDYLREALKRDEQHVKCRTNLGAALYQMGRQDEAQRELRSVLEIDSNALDAHYNLGNVLIEQGQDEEAMTEFDVVLKTQPNHVKALVNAGVLHYQNAMNAQARDYLERALSLAPDEFTALLNMARVAERLNDLGRARSCIEGALQQQPDHPSVNLLQQKLIIVKRIFKELWHGLNSPLKIRRMNICVSMPCIPKLWPWIGCIVRMKHLTNFQRQMLKNDWKRLRKTLTRVVFVQVWSLRINAWI